MREEPVSRQDFLYNGNSIHKITNSVVAPRISLNCVSTRRTNRMNVNCTRRAFIKKGMALIGGLHLSGCGGGGGGSGTTVAAAPPAPQSPIGVGPAFLMQPSDQSVAPGESATFQALANGTEPLSYQWSRNGTPISGATNLTYTTPATLPGDDAFYSVTVSNNAGMVTSRDAQLTVAVSTITVDATAITIDSTALTVDAS